MSTEEGYQTLILQFDRWVRYFLNHVKEGDPTQSVRGNQALARQIEQEYAQKVVRRRNGWIRMLEGELQDYVREYGGQAFRDPRHPAARYKQSRQRTVEKELHSLHRDFINWAKKLHARLENCDCDSDSILQSSP